MSNLLKGQIDDIRNRLIEFCEKNPGVSNSEIAKNTGYSTATINLFKNNKYTTEKTLPEVSAKVENYLNNQMAVSREDVNGTELKFAMTHAAEMVFKTIDYSLTRGVTGLITGMPGYGKTISLKEYRRRNPTTILIEVIPLVNQRILLKDICTALKLPTQYYRDNSKIPVQYPKDVMFDSIVNQLKGTNRLLIIDEGENLNIQCLELIRRIQDLTKVGILLSGTSRLRNRLRGERQELQQLFSRVGIQTEIDKLQLSDVSAILSVNFPSAKSFASTFLSLSKNNGRLLQHLIALVKMTQQQTGEQITDQLIDDAAESLLR